MARLLSALVYILVFLPIWLVRRVTGVSRFGRRLHHASSAWDHPIGPTAMPQPQVKPTHRDARGE